MYWRLVHDSQASNTGARPSVAWSRRLRRLPCPCSCSCRHASRRRRPAPYSRSCLCRSAWGGRACSAQSAGDRRWRKACCSVPVVCAFKRADVPPRRPANAAARARLCTVLVFMRDTFHGWAAQCPALDVIVEDLQLQVSWKSGDKECLRAETNCYAHESAAGSKGYKLSATGERLTCRPVNAKGGVPRYLFVTIRPPVSLTP